MSRKVTIKFSVEDPDTMFSRGGEKAIECYGWSESLADDPISPTESVVGEVVSAEIGDTEEYKLEQTVATGWVDV
jgi:hypothetical protein